MADNFEKKHIEDMSEEEIMNIIREDTKNIEPPDTLSPEAIEKKLRSISQVTPKKRKRTPWFIAGGIAACLALGVMAGFITYSLIKGSNNGSPYHEQVADIGGAANEQGITTGDGNAAANKSDDELDYSSVATIINNYNQANVRYRTYDSGEIDYIEEAIPEEAIEETADESAESEAAPESNSSQGIAKSDSAGSAQTIGASDDYSKTDEQVSGVEEGDIIKTNGKYIFTVENSTFGITVHIIEPNGNNSKEKGTIVIQSSNCEEMYIYENKIIIIGAEWDNDYYNSDEPDYEGILMPDKYLGADRNKQRTIISVIDIADPSYPKLVKTHSMTGSFNTSRISDGYLYTFTEDTYFSETPYDADRPEDYIPQVDGESIAPERIVRAGSDDTNNYMVMTSLSLKDGETFSDSLAALGGGATYYVSTSNIYISRIKETGTRLWSIGGNNNITSLTKIAYDNGSFEKKCQISFRGLINDSYYMHEYQNNLCFLYMGYDEEYQPYTGLCILDENFMRLGELRNIAPGERIYSSYYIDNMAYFVTYRNTDPVFAVDISDPKNPVMKSELKLPGFSSYMHSFGSDKLIGIGYGDSSKDGDQWDNTPKLSLFGIGRDYKITELSKVFTNAFENHIAGQNHKAVFIDESRGIVGLGLTGYDLDEDGMRSGFHYAAWQLKNNKLVKVLDTKDLRLETGYSLNSNNTRGVRIGETFYVCSTMCVVKAYSITADGSKWKEA